MDRKTARHVGRYCQFALAASKQALAQSGLVPGEMDPDDVGVIVSSGIGGMEEIEKSHTALMERGPKRISPFTVPMMIADMAAGIVAMHTRAGGPNYAIVSACASSAHGIGEASEIIKRGDAIAMLAGGSEATITPLTMGAFCQIKAVSERNDEPDRACRPFDLDRDGFVMGEGSVMFVLEEMEHARTRGARVLAEIVGYGASADMHHFVAPHPEGAGAVRVRRAQRNAGDPAAGSQLGERQMAEELDFKELQMLAGEILGVDPERVQMEVSFQRDLAADSLDLVELIAAIEDKYDVELPEE